jgi:hypothetical protein
MKNLPNQRVLSIVCEYQSEIEDFGKEIHGVAHRVHRVETAAFWRTFSDEGKISPSW